MKEGITSDQKLKELILYIAFKGEGDENLGATKLNKLLLEADVATYLTLGEPITGQEYFKLPQGPAPKRMVPVLNEMQTGGEIKIRATNFYGYAQNKPIALRQPDISIFTANQIALVDAIIEANKGKTGSEMSEDSHTYPGWKLAKNKEIIPYSVFRVRKLVLTEDEEEYAKGLEDAAQKALARHG